MGPGGFPLSLAELGIETSVKVGFDVNRMDEYFVNYGAGIYGLDEADLNDHKQLLQTEFDVKLMTLHKEELWKVIRNCGEKTKHLGKPSFDDGHSAVCSWVRKTYLESAMAMPLLQSKESGERQQCLFVCDTNRSADATAIRVQNMANELVKRKDGSEVVVIRIFSSQTLLGPGF
ncbi:hypothetical protein PoHVEF18_000980 [Penicillium ochrochloron]